MLVLEQVLFRSSNILKQKNGAVLAVFLLVVVVCSMLTASFVTLSKNAADVSLDLEQRTRLEALSYSFMEYNLYDVLATNEVSPFTETGHQQRSWYDCNGTVEIQISDLGTGETGFHGMGEDPNHIVLNHRYHNGNEWKDYATEEVQPLINDDNFPGIYDYSMLVDSTPGLIRITKSSTEELTVNYTGILPDVYYSQEVIGATCSVRTDICHMDATTDPQFLPASASGFILTPAGLKNFYSRLLSSWNGAATVDGYVVTSNINDVYNSAYEKIVYIDSESTGALNVDLSQIQLGANSRDMTVISENISTIGNVKFPSNSMHRLNLIAFDTLTLSNSDTDFTPVDIFLNGLLFAGNQLVIDQATAAADCPDFEFHGVLISPGISIHLKFADNLSSAPGKLQINHDQANIGLGNRYIYPQWFPPVPCHFQRYGKRNFSFSNSTDDSSRDGGGDDSSPDPS